MTSPVVPSPVVRTKALAAGAADWFKGLGLPLRRRHEILAATARQQITRLGDSGAFGGVHLIPVNRYREISARLEALT